MTMYFSCHDKAQLDDTAQFCEELKAPFLFPSLWISVTTDPALIYALIREVPKGEVASYGMIASLLPGVGPRQVGSALSHMPRGLKAPWQRIVQSGGAIAERAGAGRQRTLLRKEGVTFRKNGAVDWKKHLWRGPSQQWIIENDLDPNDVMEIIAGWGR